MFSLILGGGLREHRGASFVPFLAPAFAPKHKSHLAWHNQSSQNVQRGDILKFKQ